MQTNDTKKIADAMIMAGLTSAQVQSVMGGATIYGDEGIVDSLGLVRLISAVSSVFESDGLDLFDMMVTLDAEAAETFANFAGIKSFLTRIRATQLEAV